MKTPPLRDLAIALARDKNIPLADAQRVVYAAAERARAADARVEPGSGQWLRSHFSTPSAAPAPVSPPPSQGPTAPPTSDPAAIADLSISRVSRMIAGQHNIPLNEAQKIAYVAITRARELIKRGQ